jgi:hypothetical protein
MTVKPTLTASNECLKFARDVWREFDLNNSKGAGMTLIENGEIVKEHGKATDTSDLKVMGDIFTTVVSSKSGARKSTKSTPTSPQTLKEVM